MKLSSRIILLTYTTLLSNLRGEARAEQIRLISLYLQRAVASSSQLELARLAQESSEVLPRWRNSITMWTDLVVMCPPGGDRFPGISQTSKPMQAKAA